MSRQEEILRVLAPGVRRTMSFLSLNWDDIEEIRLRAGQPLALTWCGQSVFVSDAGQICNGKDAHKVTSEELRETMNLLSNYSRYAFEDKIRQGFLTIQGGHRVGLTGRVIVETKGAASVIKTIAPITGLNLRVARQIIGCAEWVLPYLWTEEGTVKSGSMYDTLLISPPGGGKTTLLRDLIRLLSLAGTTVGVVDERSELGACHQGVPQNDLGPRTDVLDGCPKADGLMMLVRTMAPGVIAVDEVGSREDHQALEYAMHCGCQVLATAHGSSWEEMLLRPVVGEWLTGQRFGRYVFVENERKDQRRCYGYRICDSAGKVIGMVKSGV